MSLLIVSLVIFFALLFLGLVSGLRSIMSKNITSATQHLGDLSLEYARKEKEIQKQFEEMKLKSQEILSKALDEAEKQKYLIIKQAQEEKQKVLESAKQKAQELMQQAEFSRSALMQEIENKIDQRAVTQALELLQKALPEGLREDIHSRWLNDLISGGLDELSRLKLAAGLEEAKVVSAFSLSPEQSRALTLKMKEKLGHQLKIQEEVNPRLIAGIIVYVGSIVFDGSLQSKIKESVYAK